MATRTYWYDTSYLWFWLFNVGTNQASLIWTPHRYAVVIDCGASPEFAPFKEVITGVAGEAKTYKNPYDTGSFKPEAIAQLVVSHPHEDHITEFGTYFEVDEQGLIPFNPYYVTCPFNKGQGTLDEFDYSRCSPEALKGELLKTYRDIADHPQRQLPLRIIAPQENDPALDLELGLYFVKPGCLEEQDDFDYVNASSLVYFIKYGNNRLLIPGDITNRALEQIIEEEQGMEKRYSVFGQNRSKNHVWYRENADQPSLKECVARGLSVLIAPHHGSDSPTYFPDVIFGELNVKPRIVLASEEIKTDGKFGGISPRYSDKDLVKGHDIYVDGTKDIMRRLVSTRRGHIVVIMSPDEIRIKQTQDDIDYLLTLEV
jgi:hypothetical protein